MDDLISRQAAIDAAKAYWYKPDIAGAIEQLPSAQPEITDEQAILHLQTSGWMQTHDKEMSEMGLREKLADDSDSYDALLPSAQPDDRLAKIAALVEGTIDHFDLDDAMDLLYQIKEVLK